ncbi:MAG: hypothetical protein KA319_03935 [Ferruginibacter sp.]|nr:hypothetical protein [Ferruginibacter sp.]
MIKKLSLIAINFIFLCFVISCQKNIPIDNNPPSGGTGDIGQFSVTVLPRSQTTDTIKWTIPNKPVGTTLKYKVYLSNTLLSQNLTDTFFIITNLVPNQSYQGKVVAYTSSTDSAFASFSIPVYTAATNPYSYLNGYYKVSENEYDLTNRDDSNSLIFTGKIVAFGDSSIAFYQNTRIPNTWWAFNFGGEIWRSLNDSLISIGTTVRGKVVNLNTISLNYIYGVSTTTSFFVKQTWTKLQNPADSVAYAYQWPSENNNLIKTFAGNDVSNSQFILGDGGQAVNASLRDVSNFYMDAQQNAYISCFNNSSIRKVNSTGIISTIAGNHTDGFSGDGGLAVNAQLNGPSGVVSDANGNIYISDAGNRRIRKVNNSGIISTFAGTGQGGFSGEGSLAILANIGAPRDLASDQQGNLYFITGSRVCKIDILTGILSRVAGTGVEGYSGDGGLATTAKINNPSGLTIDLQGNLYIADNGNNIIRKVNSNGIISTFVGMFHFQSADYYFNDGVLATSVKINVYDIAIDDVTGNFYINSGTGGLIFKVNTLGQIYKYAGYGSINFAAYCKWSIGPQFFNGDNGSSFNAALTSRYGIFCKNSILYGTGVKRIRKIFLLP